LIQDELELITVVFKDINKTTVELENKPEMANNIIRCLKNRSKEDLRDLNIDEIINITMDAKNGPFKEDTDA
jgi:hypothetical protein